MKDAIKLFFAVTVFLSACKTKQNYGFDSSIEVTISNPLPNTRFNVLVFLPAEKLMNAAPDFNQNAFTVFDGESEVSSQFNKKDVDYRGIVVVLDSISGNEKRQLTIAFNKAGEIEKSYPKKTQAELSHKIDGEWKDREYIGGKFKNVDSLRVPPEHKDHSWFIRYEGPGWESDKVGYRFYLDQRNANDVFGKKTKDPVLHTVGLDGFDSYHEMQPWGTDVMKVGKSLGIGSIGMLTDSGTQRVEKTDSVASQISENGAVYSSIKTDYYGWQTNSGKFTVQSRLSIHQGTRLTREVIVLSDDTERLCTGIVKDEKANFFFQQGDADQWGYLVTYGKQSLHDDNLGLAVFFNPQDYVQTMKDDYSNIVQLKSSGRKLEYYFAAAWQGETDGIQDESSFLNYVKTVSAELAHPVVIEFSTPK